MDRNFWKWAALAALLAAGPARSEDLAAKVERHKASCPSSAEACPIKQPEGFGGWTLLGSGVDLDGRGDWWLAKFSKDFGGKIRLADGNGRLHEISVSFGGGKAAPKAAKPAAQAPQGAAEGSKKGSADSKGSEAKAQSSQAADPKRKAEAPADQKASKETKGAPSKAGGEAPAGAAQGGPKAPAPSGKASP